MGHFFTVTIKYKCKAAGRKREFLLLRNFVKVFVKFGVFEKRGSYKLTSFPTIMTEIGPILTHADRLTGFQKTILVTVPHTCSETGISYHKIKQAI